MYISGTDPNSMEFRWGIQVLLGWLQFWVVWMKTNVSPSLGSVFIESEMLDIV